MPAGTNFNFFIYLFFLNMCKLFQRHHVCGCADASWSPRFMRCQCGVRRGRSTVALGRGGGRVNALWMCIQASVHIRSWETEIQGDPVWSNPQVVFLLRSPLPTRLPPTTCLSPAYMWVFPPQWQWFSSDFSCLLLYQIVQCCKKCSFCDVIEGSDTSPEPSQVFFLPLGTPSGPPRSSPPSKHVQEGPTSQH